MYFRKKTSEGRAYLQIVHSRREGAAVRQQVIATLGRIDELQASGQLERLLRSGARFADKAIVLDALNRGEARVVVARRIGPALAFERVWEETGCRSVIERLASARKHGFSLERATFLTVLHRLFCGGSDRAADRWREDYAIDGVEGLELHHLYRAMAWLGEELPADQQEGATPFSPRCVKDVLEEELFAHRRDLLTTLDVVFMDTTSLYFEGERRPDGFDPKAARIRRPVKVKKCAIQPHFAGVGFVDARNVLDLRRLPRAIVADQRQHFA